MRNFTTKLFLFFIFLGYGSRVSAQLQKGVEVRKIWEGAGHSAFTDLIRFQGYFYCSFREGSGHVPGTDGTVRILKSKDGRQWEVAAELTKEGIDLRDPKLSITPKGQLMVIMGGSVYKGGKLLGRYPHVSFSDRAGKKFSAPEKVVVDPEIVSWGDWIWRVTWNKGTGYAIDYQIGPEERRGPTAMYLLMTKDGKSFKKVSQLNLDGFPNEATVRFDKKGVLYVLIRRELGDQMGVMARSEAPYTQWEYEKLDFRLGGPNFLFTEDQKWIVGSRVHAREVHTGIFKQDEKGKLRELIKLPSGGDNSYPGMLIYNGVLYVSYYSSHEGKASIYFTEIPLSYIKELEKAPEMLPSTKIWNTAAHSAFTDLVRYKGAFFCTFREAPDHSPAHRKEGEDPDGRIRVIRSEDGKKWESIAEIAEKGIDLRDPKLAVMPDGRLMLTCGGSDYQGKDLMEWHTRVMFSTDGKEWSAPRRVKGIPSNNWFFRITWKGGTGYVAANVCGAFPETSKVNTKQRKLIIYSTTDGLNYEPISADFNPTPEGCEATIRFKEDETMVVCIRNAGGVSTSGILAFAKAPYNQFRFEKIDHGMGGQNLLQLSDNQWLVVTREYENERPEARKGTATVLLLVDEKGDFRRLYELPSGGDTSYPGLVIHDGTLWISYYSSHEDKSSIYLSTLPMEMLKSQIKTNK